MEASAAMVEPETVEMDERELPRATTWPRLLRACVKRSSPERETARSRIVRCERERDSCSDTRCHAKPAVRGLVCGLPLIAASAARRSATSRVMPSAPSRSTVSSACSRICFARSASSGRAADDDRTVPAGAGAGQKQRCAKPLLDLCGGGEVLGLIGALQSTVAPSRAPAAPGGLS
jgi:hypothetical protein